MFVLFEPGVYGIELDRGYSLVFTLEVTSNGGLGFPTINYDVESLFVRGMK